MTYDFTERINTGMEWLDANVPGWVDRIDLSKLDMETGGLCVLGQLLGSWAYGMDWDHDDYYAWSDEHGFSCFDLFHRDDVEEEFWNASLTEPWTEAIKRRRELAEVV